MKGSRFSRITLPTLVFIFAVGKLHGQTIGIPVQPLEEGPWVFDTAEQDKIRVSVVARGLSHPWAIAFLPEGGLDDVAIEAAVAKHVVRLRAKGIVPTTTARL